MPCPYGLWQILAISLLLTGILNGLARETPEHFSAASPAISESVNQQVSEIAMQILSLSEFYLILCPVPA
jgi:hypothetical protein